MESGEYKPGAGGITFQSPEMKAILENETRNGGLSESLGTKTNRLKTFYDLPDPALPVDRTQRFLDGAVSYTQNSETTTWYSYDGRGRVEWIVQDLGVLGITGMQTAIGATFKTRVYPGDSVNMEVYVKYSNFETNEVDILPTIVSYLESSFGLPATADGPLEIFDFMNAPEFASLAAWDDVNDNQPRAFLNYIVFDDKFQVQ